MYCVSQNPGVRHWGAYGSRRWRSTAHSRFQSGTRDSKRSRSAFGGNGGRTKKNSSSLIPLYPHPTAPARYAAPPPQYGRLAVPMELRFFELISDLERSRSLRRGAAPEDAPRGRTMLDNQLSSPDDEVLDRIARGVADRLIVRGEGAGKPERASRAGVPGPRVNAEIRRAVSRNSEKRTVGTPAGDCHRRAGQRSWITWTATLRSFAQTRITQGQVKRRVAPPSISYPVKSIFEEAAGCILGPIWGKITECS